MEFEWDERKSADCHRRRGFDFVYASQVFMGSDRLLEIDDRSPYGEVRRRILGKIENRVFVVVYTLRADRIRIISARKVNISARKANVREVRRYGNHAGKA